MDRRVYDNYVKEVVKQGSLTKAAACLGVTQPALSSGLSNLEKELGIRIFNRRTIPVSLTSEGALYYDYLQRIQTLEEDLYKRIDQLNEARETRVTIGGPVAYVESLVIDAIVKLRKMDPRCRVSVKCSPLSELIDMAGKGEVDCFISTSAELPENFVCLPIRREIMYLCIPKAFQVDQKMQQAYAKVQDSCCEDRAIDYSILDGETFISLEQDQPLQKEVVKFFKQYGICPCSDITVNQVSTAMHFAVRGEGICFISDESLHRKMDISELSIYPLPDAFSGRQIYVAYDKELVMTEAGRQFIEVLQEL